MLAVWRRGRLGTVCARGAHPAWSSGPSTSPLDAMQRLAPSLAVALLCLSINASASDTLSPFDARSLREVQTLAALPGSISSTLGWHDGIADRGGRFNSTDVVDPALPMRRFVLGGASACCVLVAYEQGGRGYSVQVRAFVHGNSGWTQVRQWTLWTPPATLQELVKRIGVADDGV